MQKKKSALTNAKASKTKNDGWENILTGRGRSNVDKKVHTQFAASTIVDHTTLTWLYAGDGMAKRVVDVPVEDMTREWFTVEGDTENEVIQRLDTLKAKSSIASALRWGSLFGGAIVLLGIDDGGELKDPLDEENIKQIDFMKVFDRWYSSVNTRYEDPKNPMYGNVETYMISPKFGGASFIVHESRVLRFEGSDAPYDIRVQLDGWGMSDLQAIWERLRGLAEGYDDIEHIIEEFIIGTLTIANLADMIAGGEDDLVKKRLNLIDLSKHIINTVLLDESEKFERVTSTVAGLPDLITKLENALSAVSGIPVTRLFGQTPSGLNSNGASDIRQYYDSIGSRQEERLQSQLERLTRLVMLEKNGEFNGKELDSWAICFNSLWQPTEKEISETRLNTAKTDEIYVNSGVLTPEEVAQSRFGGETYSADTKLAADRSILEGKDPLTEEDDDAANANTPDNQE